MILELLSVPKFKCCGIENMKFNGKCEQEEAII